MEILWLILAGAVVGIAEVIPGVSGGTLAVMLKIYDRLIGAISHLRTDFKKSVKFLIPLVIGMGAAILVFSHIISYLLENFPMAVNFLFLGLIVGIIPMLIRKAVVGPFKIYNLLPFAVLFGVMVVIAVLNPDKNAAMPVYRELSLPLVLKLMGTGFVAALCMILPGISGSMMMVIFGMYETVITAVKELNILILLFAGIGMLLGVAFGAKLVEFGLKKFPQATYYGILGLVAGSTITLFQRAGISFATPQGYVALLTLVVGIAVSLFFTSEKSLNATGKSAETAGNGGEEPVPAAAGDEQAED